MDLLSPIHKQNNVRMALPSRPVRCKTNVRISLSRAARVFCAPRPSFIKLLSDVVASALSKLTTASR